RQMLLGTRLRVAVPAARPGVLSRRSRARLRQPQAGGHTRAGGLERELARRFLALATHYVLEPCFARPRTGHDKGGVEARGKGVRWQQLVPIPSGPDLESISRELLERLHGAAEKRPGSDGRMVAELFTEELPSMLPLPGRPFRAAAADTASVSRRVLVKVGAASYSVWCDWAGLDVTTYLDVD